MQMYRSLSAYDTSHPFVPWLRGIARHVVHNFWRSRSREKKRTSVFRDFVEARADDAAESRIPRSLLQHCIDALQERQKQIVNMRYFDGLDSSRIGEALKMKATTVRQALARIRQALKACVESSV